MASLSPAVIAQTQATPAPTTRFDPLETFAPIAMPEAVNRYRSGDGSPGPDYWQNRADYDIAARLDPVSKVLTGTVTITYTNNSPSQLTSLWLQLDQNTYRPNARNMAVMSHWRRADQVTQGITIESVQVERAGRSAPGPYLVSDTRMRVPLDRPLEAHGGKLKLKIAYHYTMPGAFGGHTAWVDTKNGPIFDVAQWYPRMEVFDDIRGWDTLPFIVQEFYLEYGDFDYAVTVPAGMLVLGNGELMNPQEVLTSEQRARLAEARNSETTVMIRTPEEVARDTAAPPPSGEKTWRYHMSSTRDVDFSASKAFIWDAARIDLPGGKTALAESVYPVESAGPAAWGRSTEYTKDAIQRFSLHWYPYPYPTAVSIAGGASGIEYPGLVFDGIADKGKGLFWITAHEFGHTWFPMTVGSNERRDAWMDEGFNTFIDTYESDEFEDGVYGPKRDSEYAPGGGNPVDEILPLLADPHAPPIMTRADLISERYRHPVTYFKTALGLRLLREEILGPERFDAAFRKYIADWAFKHPKPSDFFRAMDSEAGEDLAWWWRGWFLENWQMDLAVTGVAYVDDDPAKGAKITVETLDKLIAPTTLEVRYADGSSRRVPVAVETWELGAVQTLPVAGGPRILSVTIDPDHKLPDRDRGNNTFTAGS
ncbi:MAG: M1 family metallopeptidase [Caulobacteraceae bacterium]|nr:M1 family metallopeptidase [Caulobacteraceae bacterium]